MLGLTPLGVFHTAIALAAVASGIACFARAGRIVPGSTAGRLYIVLTVIACITGFGIFQRGGFGDPHVLGIVTLVVLGVAALAGRTGLFGRLSPYVETIAYSATFFFHMIPGVVETTTRLPVGAPLFPGPEAPQLQAAIGVMFVLFLAGSWLQMRRLRAQHRFMPA
jgi:hypothetical protein